MWHLCVALSLSSMFSQLRNVPRWSGKAAGLVLAMMPLLPLVGVAEPVVPTTEEVAVDGQREDATQGEEVAASDTEQVYGVVGEDVVEPSPETEASVSNLVLADTPVAPMSPVPEGTSNAANFQVSPLAVLPGSETNFKGACTLNGKPATNVWASFARKPLADTDRQDDLELESIPFDKNGNVDFNYVIPVGAKPGEYKLFVGCGLDDMGFGVNEFDFVILGDIPTLPKTSPPSISGPAVLAETGGGVPLAAVWCAVVAGVTGVVLVTRSRQLRSLAKAGRRTR